MNNRQTDQTENSHADPLPINPEIKQVGSVNNREGSLRNNTESRAAA
jgi:hypothetical protein